MLDPLYSPVLNYVMVPKDTFDNIFSYVESHSDYMTYIPNAKFVKYNESFDMMKQFIEDAIIAIDQNSYNNDDISIATQKFIAETAELWPREPIYHNRILKFMESAYMIPEKTMILRNQLIVEHPNLTDAITYMTTKYLESYMDNVTKEIKYIDGYINGEKIAPMVENFSGFQGYYMAEDLGSQIAAIPGMILALVKKLLNGISYSLSEASKKFASRILADNQINENAIQEIYKLYQAKSKANAQSPIKYPDPQQVHQLRQSFSTGFKTFSEQMVKAINDNNFTAVDQGVVKMVSNFRVVTSNKTLPMSASYQEFRTAILSIANNILMMDDFMQALVQIDDAIAQKYGNDPKALKKAVGALDNQTAANKENMTQQNASIEDIFDTMFDTMFESGNNKKVGVKAKPQQSNVQPNVQSDTKNNVNHNVQSNTQSKQNNQQQEQSKSNKPNPNDNAGTNQMSKEEKKAQRKAVNQQNLSDAADGFSTAVTQGISTFANRDLNIIISNLISKIVVQLGDRIVPMAVEAIGGLLGLNNMVESVDIVDSLLEANVQVRKVNPSNQQPNSNLQPPPENTSNTLSQDQPAQTDDQPIDVSELGVNPDGDINSNVFNLSFLEGIIKKLKLDKIYESIKNAIMDIIEKFIGGKLEGQDNSSNKQQTNESYDPYIEDFLMEAGIISSTVDKVRGVWTFLQLKSGWKNLTGNTTQILNANKDNWMKTIEKVSSNICGRLKLVEQLGRVRKYYDMQMNGKDGIAAFKQDKELHKTLGTLALIVTGVTGVVVIQMVSNKNPIDALKSTFNNFSSGKVPAPKRASANIANTKQAVPDLIQNLWNNADKSIKNLYMFVNGWLYGGQSIKGSKEKTVGLAEIIRQEIESLAPYVNMKDVIQFNTEQKI